MSVIFIKAECVRHPGCFYLPPSECPCCIAGRLRRRRRRPIYGQKPNEALSRFTGWENT